MRFALLALLAATCTQQPSPPSPTPAPVVVPDPVPTPDAPPDPGTPDTQCEVAWAVQADAECAPAMGHDAWIAKCSKLPSATVACVMSVESCATMRNCLGDF